MKWNMPPKFVKHQDHLALVFVITNRDGQAPSVKATSCINDGMAGNFLVPILSKTSNSTIGLIEFKIINCKQCEHLVRIARQGLSKKEFGESLSQINNSNPI